jgi:FkbM family methyltransferase
MDPAARQQSPAHGSREFSPIMSETEIAFNLASARTLRVLDAAEWIGDGKAYWLEWDHPGETPRDFTNIVKELQRCRWPELIPPGSTCIDIGTHSGDTTIPMGMFCYNKGSGKRGNVIGVEPNPDIHPLVEACLALNGHIADFWLEKCAVTANDVDLIELSDHGNSNCNGGIIGEYSTELTDRLREVAVKTYTTKGRALETIIADYVSRGGTSSDVQFVKIDCEGYDKEIIRSSRDILSQLKPTIFAEWFAWFSPADDDDFFSAIHEVGYVALNPETLKVVDRTQRLFDVTCIHQARLKEFGAG